MTIRKTEKVPITVVRDVKRIRFCLSSSSNRGGCCSCNGKVSSSGDPEALARCLDKGDNDTYTTNTYAITPKTGRGISVKGMVE
jgi:hypothetical protein